VSSYEQITKVAARRTFQDLTDPEIAAIMNTVSADWPLRQGVQGYDKIKDLLTEAGGSKFHSLVVEALQEELLSRDAFK
jgi:hypothetical protein